MRSRAVPAIGWARDRSGVGAIEFTFIAPLLLLVVLGGSELGIALTIDRKVKETAGYTADLVSQSTELSDTDLRKLFGISKATLAPYSIRTLKVRVVQAVVSSDGEAAVDWSCQTTGFAPLAPGTPVDIPPNLVPAPKVSQALSDDLLRDAVFHDGDLLVFAQRTGEQKAEIQRRKDERARRRQELRQRREAFWKDHSPLNPQHSAEFQNMVQEEDDLDRQDREADRMLQEDADDPTVIDPDRSRPPSRKTEPTRIYAIYAEAEYAFAPVTGRVFDHEITLTGKTYSLPRYSEKVNSMGCATFGF